MSEEMTDEQVISAALVYSGGARPVQKLCERLLARNARIKELEAKAKDWAETLVELNSEGLISLEVLECVEMEEFIRSVGK